MNLEHFFMIGLFPAQAGVIPKSKPATARRTTVPRASGGDPKTKAEFQIKSPCSPRKRG